MCYRLELCVPSAGSRTMAAARFWMSVPVVVLPLLLVVQAAAAEQVALVEVFLEQPPDVSAAVLQGEVVESSGGSRSPEAREELQGALVLVSRGLRGVLGCCTGSKQTDSYSCLLICLCMYHPVG